MNQQKPQVTHTIEEFINGVWVPLEVFESTEEFTSKELAQASLFNKRSLRLDGMDLYRQMRIMKTITYETQSNND
tara:strand:+ start:921 stop:1145 length:225 start_codon:yes stop_codon:yes gene_type:complete